MTKNKMMQDLLQVGVMAAIVAFALPDMSWAQGSDLGQTTKDFAKNQLINIPSLITAICYIGGIILMVSGSMQLKAHAENPAQTKLAPGVSRLVVGGVIAALPSLMGWINATTQVKGTAITYTGLNPSF